MKRKRPIRTPEERARSEEVERQLRERIESIRAELRAKGKEPIEDIHVLDRAAPDRARDRQAAGRLTAPETLDG